MTHKNSPAIAGAVVLIVLAAALPYAGISNRGLHTAVLVCIFGVAAYGLGMLYRSAGQLSVAHGSLMGIGAYTAAILTQTLGLSFWVCLPLAMMAAALAAGLIGYPSLRVKGHYFLIVTFGFSEIFRTVAINWRGLTNGETGIVIAKAPEPLLFIEVGSRISWYYFSLTALVVAILASALIFRSGFGLRLEALRENESLARAAGVNVARDKIVAFMVSGLFAGAAGAMLAYYQHFISPHQFGSKAGIELILMLLVGGSASLLGPIVGVIVVVALPGALDLSPSQNEIVLGVIFIAIILLLPRGLISVVDINKVRRVKGNKSEARS